MLKSFRDERTRRIWDGEVVTNLPQEIQERAREKLRTLNRTAELLSLRVPPSNHFEALHGRRRGKYSIRINRQWRITFRWEDGDAHDVSVEDYH